MDARNFWSFCVFSYFFFLICIVECVCESPESRPDGGLSRRKFTGSRTAESHEGPKIILFIFGVCTIGAFIRTLFNRVLFLPYELLLIVVGLLLGTISVHVDGFQPFTSIIRDAPQNVFYILLPAVIFKIAYFLDYHVITKAWGQVVGLGLPLGVGAAVAYGLFAKYVLKYSPYWSANLMFGAMISIIDPVTILNIVKDISQGSQKTLVVLLQGEAVVRCIVSVVMYTVWHYLAEPGANRSVGHVVLQIFLMTALSPLLGFILGKLTYWWLQFVFNDPVTEIMITMSSVYLTFWLGESVFGCSGVFAVIVLGITLSAEKTSVNLNMEAFQNKFWDWLGTTVQTLVFAMAGVALIERASQHLEGSDIARLLGLYFFSCGLRLLSVLLMGPILKKSRMRIDWKQTIVLAWVGIRGTVTLILALQVIMDRKLDASLILQSKILFHCIGLVILTMLINVTSLHWVPNMLGLETVSPAKRMAMAGAIRALRDVRMNAVSMYKTDRFLADADWDLVDKHVIVKDPYQTTDDEAVLGTLTHPSVTMVTEDADCENCEGDKKNANANNNQERFEMWREARLRLLKAEKMAFWKQYESGMISREAVRYLVQTADEAIDSPDSYIDAEKIKKSWKGAEKYSKIIEKLKHWQYQNEKVERIPPPTQRCLQPFFRLSLRPWFDSLIMFLVVVNIVLIILEVVEDGRLCKEEMDAKYGKLFKVSNYLFVAIYTLEAIIKIAGFRHWYFKSVWNWFDFLIVVLSYIDIALDFTVFKNIVTNSCFGDDNDPSFSSFNPGVLKIAKVVRMLRILRVLKLLKALIPRAVQYVNGLINKQLRFGYNVGKGFVTAEEEVLGYIDYLVDDQEIADVLTNRCTITKEFVIHGLGQLQKEFPGVAVSVKTHQASRRILNIQLEKVYSMRSEAIIDEVESAKLEGIIQGHIKRLHQLPAYIEPPPPERMLRNLPWLQNDEYVMEHIKNNARLVSFTEGEFLDAEGDPRAGLYIIISGLVKVTGVMEDNSNYDAMLQDRHFLQKLGMRHLTTQPSLTSLRDETSYTDYLSTGQTVGEIAFLTNVKRNARVKCDTSVQLYHVMYETVQAAVDIFTDEPSLEKRMWKFCAVRIGLALLQNHFAFRRWSAERLRAHLDKGYIWMRHTLTDGSVDPDHSYHSVFNINPSTMIDIILVHGVIGIQNQTVTAPCYIPNTLPEIILVPCREEKHVLLIVPRDATLDLGRIASTTSVGNTGSALCLRHASLMRSSVLTRMSRPQQLRQITESKLSQTIPEVNDEEQQDDGTQTEQEKETERTASENKTRKTREEGPKNRRQKEPSKPMSETEKLDEDTKTEQKTTNKTRKIRKVKSKNLRRKAPYGTVSETGRPEYDYKETQTEEDTQTDDDSTENLQTISTNSMTRWQKFRRKKTSKSTTGKETTEQDEGTHAGQDKENHATDKSEDEAMQTKQDIETEHDAAENLRTSWMSPKKRWQKLWRKEPSKSSSGSKVADEETQTEQDTGAEDEATQKEQDTENEQDAAEKQKGKTSGRSPKRRRREGKTKKTKLNEAKEDSGGPSRENQSQSPVRRKKKVSDKKGKNKSNNNEDSASSSPTLVSLVEGVRKWSRRKHGRISPMEVQNDIELGRTEETDAQFTSLMDQSVMMESEASIFIPDRSQFDTLESSVSDDPEPSAAAITQSGFVPSSLELFGVNETAPVPASATGQELPDPASPEVDVPMRGSESRASTHKDVLLQSWMNSRLHDDKV